MHWRLCAPAAARGRLCRPGLPLATLCRCRLLFRDPGSFSLHCALMARELALRGWALWGERGDGERGTDREHDDVEHVERENTYRASSERVRERKKSRCTAYVTSQYRLFFCERYKNKIRAPLIVVAPHIISPVIPLVQFHVSRQAETPRARPECISRFPAQRGGLHVTSYVGTTIRTSMLC